MSLHGPSKLAERISLRLAAFAVSVECLGEPRSPEHATQTIKSIISTMREIERDTRFMADALKRIADRADAELKNAEGGHEP